MGFIGYLCILVSCTVFASSVSGRSTCPYNSYGDDCDGTCSENCRPNPGLNITLCHGTDGRCIYGCRPSHWGPKCDDTCNRNCQHQSCNSITGSCTKGCQNHYYGDRCQNSCGQGCLRAGNSTCQRDSGNCNNGCRNDYYGDKCEEQCNVNCLRNSGSKSTSCDMSNGFCSEGCRQGQWGTTCNETCHDNCQRPADLEICDRNSGTCTQGCKDLYYGTKCQQSCSKECLVVTGRTTCHQSTGDCTHGCNNGYYGKQCTLSCDPNCLDNICRINDGRCTNGCTGPYWGDKCISTCNPQCIKNMPEICSQSNGSCTHGCQDLYYGKQCDLKCSNNCRVKSGYNTCHRDTGDCNSGCKSGFYGEKCKKPCANSCAAFNGKPICEQRDGRCYKGCQDGWFGVHCEKQCELGCRPLPETSTGACNQSDEICTHGCRDGLFGVYCRKECNQQCTGAGGVRVCERYSGSCACQIGHYGETCEYPCSIHCETVGSTQTCDKVNGVCSHGCQLPPYDTWHTGDYCNHSIIYVEYPESDYINITEVTTDTITVEWSHVEGIPLDTTAIFGFKISVIDKRTNESFNRNRSSHIEIRKENVSSNYSHILSDLSANTTYLIVINIYRQLESGKIEDSRHNSSVAVTTSSNIKKGMFDQFDQTGPIAGAVVAVVFVATTGILIFVLVLRWKRPMKLNNDADVQNEDMSIHPSIKSPNKDTNFTSGNKINNPSFERRLDTNNSRTIYYEFPSTRSIDDVTCVKAENLEVYIGAKKDTEDDFKKEYEDIPNGELKPCGVSEQQGNVNKNRYKNIKAYDCSRVVLEANNEEDKSGYVNASFITGYPKKMKYYVATQGPKPDTIRDMWLMIWQLQSNRIVMLTRIKELKKMKCEQYWPENVGEVMSFGDIKLTTSACEIYADYNLTRINIQKGNERRVVNHLQFLSWPDKQTPDQAFPLMAFRRKLRSLDREGVGPTIVHCSAGVGRTGTLIALDYLLDQMKREGKVDVFKLVTQLRNERMNMVQTLQQYIFVYDTLLEAHQQGETAIPCSEYPARYKQLVAENEYSNELPLDVQHKILFKMKQPKSSQNIPIGLCKENSGKNRDNSIMPDTKHRLFLTTNCPGTNDYVNAVVVNSFLSQKAFIVTQLPLPDTVVDFWRLVYEHKCHTVVTLEGSSVGAKDCPKYWAIEEDHVRQFGNLEVRRELTEDIKDCLEERKFTLSYSSSNKSVNVRHVLFKPWSDHQSLPSTHDTLDLLERIRKWQHQKEGGNIIIQCKDGARRSGLICAANYMLEKMEADKEVDAFLAVRAVALSRHQFVNDQEQYRFLHDIAMEYVARNDIYQNLN